MPLYRIDYRLAGSDQVSTMLYDAFDLSGVLHRLQELYPDDLDDLLIVYRIPDKE